jgi:hypothetical protein
MVRKRMLLTKNIWKYIRNALSSGLQSYAQIALIPCVYSYYTIPRLYSIMKDLDSLWIFCYSSNIATKKGNMEPSHDFFLSRLSQTYPRLIIFLSSRITL